MMAGAFQTSRDIFENPIWQNVVEFRLFFLIYGKAIFSEEGYVQSGVKLEKGQWVRSYRNIQSDLEYIENRSVKRYSLSTIKRAVDHLIKDERIKIEQCELGTLFTVLNYARYQGLENYRNYNENAERTENERRENGNETERERQRNNNKKGNKDKECKEGIDSTSDIDIKEVSSTSKTKTPKEEKIKYAELVSMTEKEYEKLTEQFSQEDTDRMVEILDNYKGANGKKYASDYRAILSWVVDRLKKEQETGFNPNKPSGRKVADF